MPHQASKCLRGVRGRGKRQGDAATLEPGRTVEGGGTRRGELNLQKGVVNIYCTNPIMS